MSKDPFKTRLEIAKKKAFKEEKIKKPDPSPIGNAFKLSTELVSAVAVGTIIGFILDKTFGTCLLYTSPSPRDEALSRMPSSA